MKNPGSWERVEPSGYAGGAVRVRAGGGAGATGREREALIEN